MAKKLLIVISSLLISIFALCACGYNPKPIEHEDYSKADVVGNGGLAVKQGKYLYFVNGVSDYTSSNKIGAVVKGAIMRYTLDEQDNITGDPVTIVPKKVFSSYAGAGIYVYGDWIYYVTPSEVSSASGKTLTDYIEFMRTKVDGTGTQTIKRIEGNSTQYAFINGFLVYYSDNKLVSINCENKKETVISETVSSYYIPKVVNKADSKITDADNLVYFIENKPEDDKSSKTYNSLYAVTADGNIKVKLITFDTYDKGNDYTKCYTLSISGYADDVLYFVKSYTANGESTTAGTYAYNFKDFMSADAAYEASRETKITPINYSMIYPMENGKYLLADSSDMYIYDSTAATYDKLNKEDSFATITKLNNIKDGYVYYTGSSQKLYRYKLDGTKVVEPLIKDTFDTTFLYPTLIGENVYYIKSDDYKYCYVAKIGDKEGKMIGIMSEADESAKASASVSATAK